MHTNHTDIVATELEIEATRAAARPMLAPKVIPVSILTAFLGAPTFLYLLIRRGIK